MAKEIEYKHICKQIPEKWKSGKRKLSQGYIHIDPYKQVRVRVDWLWRKAWMCIKYMDGNTRDEFEVEMDFQEGCELFGLCKYKLSKNRYSQLWGNYIFDIDEYENGILIIEVETDDENYLENLPDHIKDIIGNNVDGQWKYNNYSIAGFSEEEYNKSK